LQEFIVLSFLNQKRTIKQIVCVLKAKVKSKKVSNEIKIFFVRARKLAEAAMRNINLGKLFYNIDESRKQFRLDEKLSMPDNVTELLLRFSKGNQRRSTIFFRYLRRAEKNRQ
jgi:hypothetical protein